MAGHSKWANIKHRKGAQDAKRGKEFSKAIREITVASREGADQDANPRLRAAVEKALSINMTKDTIEKAILKGSGAHQEGQLEEIDYEGYGPGGVAYIVCCATDNRKRTVSDIRHYFTKAGGSLGQTGSVSFLFETVGLITFSSDLGEETLLEMVLEVGAEDLEESDGLYCVKSAPSNLYQIAHHLRAQGLILEEVTLEKLPLSYTQGDSELEEKTLALVEKFEDHDDVQKVYCNFQEIVLN
jgi:YebC/PmpR family DNA-binding regulatory protein